MSYVNLNADKGEVTATYTSDAEHIEELETERDRLREALQNIANGDTPWMDGYSETPGEIYQKYAKQALEQT